MTRNSTQYSAVQRSNHSATVPLTCDGHSEINVWLFSHLLTVWWLCYLRIWTIYEPYTNHIQTIYEPYMNHIWTIYEPYMNHMSFCLVNMSETTPWLQKCSANVYRLWPALRKACLWIEPPSYCCIGSFIIRKWLSPERCLHQSEQVDVWLGGLVRP